jgi:hypothetical protein
MELVSNQEPLTERILRVLPGPRWAWILIWSTVPFAAVVLPNSYIALVGRESLGIRLLTGAAFAYVTLLALWGVGKFTRHTAEAEVSLTGIEEDDGDPHGQIFRGLGSTIGPLAFASVFVVLTVIQTTDLTDIETALLWAPISVVTNIASATGVWVYVEILLGLNRLGRLKLSLDRFPQDPSLGLSQVGHVAVGAFWVYIAAWAISMLPGRSGSTRLVLSLAVFVFGVLVFFASLWRLHRKLVKERDKQIEWARALYARAYEPVRSGSLTALKEQAEVLSAAEGIEEQAEKIQRWPFSDTRFRQMLALAGTVTTFVTTGVITRFVTDRLPL